MTEIYCKCGVQTLEDTTCAECGEPLRVRWIPVSERLPEIHDDYDGEKSDCCYAIDIHKCVWIAYYRPDEKDWYELPAGIILTAITHWMPLPEPPEEPND